MPGIAYWTCNQCTCKLEPAVWLNMWQYLTIHLQQIRSDRNIIEHIYTAYTKHIRPTRRILTDSSQQTKHHHGGCALSISISHMHVHNHSNFSTPSLLHWDHNRSQGLHNHTLCRSRKGHTHSRTHASYTHNQFCHQHSVTAKIEWNVIHSGLTFACYPFLVWLLNIASFFCWAHMDNLHTRTGLAGLAKNITFIDLSVCLSIVYMLKWQQR